MGRPGSVRFLHVGVLPATRRTGSVFRGNGNKEEPSADKPVDVVGVKSESPSKFAIRPNRTCLQPRIARATASVGPSRKLCRDLSSRPGRRNRRHAQPRGQHRLDWSSDQGAVCLCRMSRPKQKNGARRETSPARRWIKPAITDESLAENDNGIPKGRTYTAGSDLPHCVSSSFYDFDLFRILQCIAFDAFLNISPHQGRLGRVRVSANFVHCTLCDPIDLKIMPYWVHLNFLFEIATKNVSTQTDTGLQFYLYFTTTLSRDYQGLSALS